MMDFVAVSTALPVYRIARDATEGDYYAENDVVKGIPDEMLNYRVKGISVFIPDIAPNKLPANMLRGLPCFKMASLGEGWRLVYTHDQSLPATKSTRQTAKHYLLYPTFDIALEDFHKEANCMGSCQWIRCQPAGGGEEEEFELDVLYTTETTSMKFACTICSESFTRT